MQFSDLPPFVKVSSVFTEEELQQLLRVEQLPDDIEIDTIRDEPEIFDLLNAFIGDENSRLIHLQLYAQMLLKRGEVEQAWKVILL
ncbi:MULTISPECIES: hypothetical protein [Sphingobacterium]|uniref:Uncharacterized protein n=1 Tax=Sphingobacterium kitahiroshimense TaxID=470446 RepID=A0ABV0BZ70_9SPHI|nr:MULTISPECIES: hypothetical protein [unclassified Sphingobacterium]KKX50974.1 hypothetical protein L950_0207440 [Sphingobacterium sp. IITKGP-BTPF85]MCS3557111.1 hypothetical protein [Sphingobacterium sp. JUb21]QQD13539.1 hypothetical protein JAZ75_23605 [Sphingobacterium sp. UDSM-2020]TCQ98154.1 hypothetical protein EDF66_117100 [Sphingobacterium sp. JUb20]